MQILRVFNNNVVLARDGEGGEVVVTGRGIGFQARQGDEVDAAKVQRVFRPTEGRDPDHSAQMIAGLPAENVLAVAEALDAVGAPATIRQRLSFIAAIADHVTLAAQRAREGKVLEYPLRAEVLTLYPDEYALGEKLLAELNKTLKDPLPQTEAVALAMHIVNAGFAGGDLSYTYRMTGVIQQMIDIVAAELGVALDSSSISVARFITHVRYLFVRLSRGEQLNHDRSVLAKQLLAEYPREMLCARKVASVVELRFDSELTTDEIAYLGLHIVRLGETERNHDD
ncbi:Transcription antiterminator LicT [Corynebacterium capitovis DSM 44611]|uniref:PRD domain-containing protein n=1 Tax=Corynebacterium capitovis TaxID=131081 RepID=UPI0003610BA7|nr:PRD domain-containing protein [Corynebacterium capitovis]WKD58151.1 Transcription antiterminator LicT [Corynebacterium capitovis DSM 44611]